jgi:ectoine hydroxylase-related dioxygenase (phytanoyl-CoA dioxygenase family)
MATPRSHISDLRTVVSIKILISSRIDTTSVDVTLHVLDQGQEDAMSVVSQSFQLSEEQLNEYNEDGVTCVRGVMSPAEIARLHIDLNWLNSGRDCNSTSKTQKVDGFCLWMRSEGFRVLACNSQLPELASRFLESSKVNLFCDHLFIKEPQRPDYLTPWHNDQPYWCVTGTQVVTFWLALDPVTTDSGGLRFVKGSHRWNFDSLSGESFEPTPGIDGNPQLHCFSQYDLAAGDMTVHQGLTVHGAGGNVTGKRRRGYVIRYTGDDVRYEPRRAFVVPGSEGLLRGQPLDSAAFPVVFSTAGIG